jgi:hypothetical protein
MKKETGHTFPIFFAGLKKNLFFSTKEDEENYGVLIMMPSGIVPFIERSETLNLQPRNLNGKSCPT